MNTLLNILVSHSQTTLVLQVIICFSISAQIQLQFGYVRLEIYLGTWPFLVLFIKWNLYILLKLYNRFYWGFHIIFMCWLHKLSLEHASLSYQLKSVSLKSAISEFVPYFLTVCSGFQSLKSSLCYCSLFILL